MGACLDDSPLMEGKGTEITSTKASTITDQRKFHFLNGGYSAILLIRRVILSHIWKCVYGIHFFLRQWLLRWILYHIGGSAIRFIQPLSRKGIGIAVLDIKATGKLFLIFFDHIVIRKLDGIMNQR